MSRHCSSYGVYLSSLRLSRTHCVKTPLTTASVDCDQASQTDGSVFRSGVGRGANLFLLDTMIPWHEIENYIEMSQQFCPRL